MVSQLFSPSSSSFLSACTQRRQRKSYNERPNIILATVPSLTSEMCFSTRFHDSLTICRCAGLNSGGSRMRKSSSPSLQWPPRPLSPLSPNDFFLYLHECEWPPEQSRTWAETALPILASPRQLNRKASNRWSAFCSFSARSVRRPEGKPQRALPDEKSWRLLCWRRQNPPGGLRTHESLTHTREQKLYHATRPMRPGKPLKLRTMKMNTALIWYHVD